MKTDKQVNNSQLLGAVLKVFIGSSTPIQQNVDNILNDYLYYLKKNSNNLTDKKTRKTLSKPIKSKRVSEAFFLEDFDEEECEDKTLQRIEQLKR